MIEGIRTKTNTGFPIEAFGNDKRQRQGQKAGSPIGAFGEDRGTLLF